MNRFGSPLPLADGDEAPDDRVPVRFAVVVDRLTSLSGSDRYLRALLDYLLAKGDVLLVFGQATDLPSGLCETVRLAALCRRRPSARSATFEKIIERLDRIVARFRPDSLIVQNVMMPALLDAMSGAKGSLCVVQDHRCFCPGPGKVFPDGAECREPFGAACDICFMRGGQLNRDLRDERLSLVRRRLLALSRFSRLVVLSSYMKSQLVDAGIAPEKIAVVPPPLPAFVREAEPAPGGSGIAVLGRICRHKGQLLLARALAEGGLRRPLRFVGGGPGEGRLRDFLSGTALDAEITGWKDDAGLLSELQRAAFVVLPSLWAEPFGMAGIEASALGLPVLATEGGGVTDWLEPERTGLLAPRNDPSSLLAACRRLEDPALRAQLGASGRRLVRHRFTQERFARDLGRAIYPFLHHRMAAVSGTAKSEGPKESH